MHFFLYQQVIQTVAQVASLPSQQNNNKQTPTNNQLKNKQCMRAID